jgi:hypothetical protein
MDNRKIRLGELASAINTTTKAISHWIQERGAEPKAAQSGVWREFGWGDVAVFAITRYLIDIGMRTHEAFSLALKIVEARWPDLFDVDEPKWTKTPDSIVMVFWLCRDGTWDFSSIKSFKFDGEFVPVPRPHETVAHVIMAVGVIVTNAFNALADMGHELPASDNSQLRDAIEVSRIRETFRAAVKKGLEGN